MGIMLGDDGARRPAFRAVAMNVEYYYVPQHGESVMPFCGCLVVAHPERSPRLFWPDGSVDEIKPSADIWREEAIPLIGVSVGG
jgi:hypothetical protein